MLKLSEYFHLNRRYARSINLERDLDNPNSVNGYVLTDRSIYALKQILVDVPESEQTQAITLTGVYGTGKSAFAHFLTCLCAGETVVKQDALAIAEKALSEAEFQKLNHNLPKKACFRAITTAQREPLAHTIIRALDYGASHFWKKKSKPEIATQLVDLAGEVRAGHKVDSKTALQLVREVIATAQTDVLLIVDELGKNLEYASLHPNEADLYLLQQLAELQVNKNQESAKRSPDSVKFYLIGLLHQSFADYGERLASLQRNEWAKIQGRFQDIPFTESARQMTRLIGQAISRSGDKTKKYDVLIDAQIDSQAEEWCETLRSQVDDISPELLAAAYPLHPITALVLPILCTRYAQNDRSLFTFLTSSEPYALRSHLDEFCLDKDCIPTLKLDRVYDYFIEAAGIGLASRPQLQKWVEIQTLVSDARNSDPESLKLLKTVGILNLVTSTGGLRASRDLVMWAMCDQASDRTSHDNYKSEISKYLADFIRSILNGSNFPQLNSKSRVGKNIKQINELLKKVENPHETTRSPYPYPFAWEIIEKLNEVDLWSYSRPDLISLVRDRSNPMTDKESQVCSLIQLFAFCHYLLQRCCFTIIQPVSDVRAFDMFQSLNATGTPLTAFETFKPLVVNFAETSGSRQFKGSNSEKFLQPTDRLLSSTGSALKKTQLTNEFLTSFALINTGFSPLSKQFSAQRKWLNSNYESCPSLEEKEEFVHRIGNLATYWERVVHINPKECQFVAGIENIPIQDKELATFCCLYLQKANHKMANAVLSRFYAQIVRDVPESDKNFAAICKIVSAFFTLWRSALPNTGLDDVYRKLMKEHLCWAKGNTNLSPQFVSTYFKNVLTDKGIGTKTEWVSRAKDSFKYETQAICRFALFVTAQDTIPDPDNLGLMKIGNLGSTPPYLSPRLWISDELKTVEHIAPQKTECIEDWDSQLYQNENYQRIGNLTLLPVEINSSLSNKGWIAKFIYYKHLSETDPDKLESLQLEAQAQGVILSHKTIELLRNSSTKQHITPIIQLGASGIWDKDFIDRRSQRICEILWDRIYKWLI